MSLGECNQSSHGYCVIVKQFDDFGWSYYSIVDDWYSYERYLLDIYVISFTLVCQRKWYMHYICGDTLTTKIPHSPKSNRHIVETGNESIPLTCIYMTTHWPVLTQELQ